ncbi:hypothetical protein PBAL39_23762 [Pedobacter sp. BAL39]|uniref:hypothetical protein n=1 Tax=Pedobacter sp. BAL39 TaxID=391596 RepID=UPI0001559539|nr:hypothetical protein [Pedobacter sp. BAL39]EDM36078.1 hypothetical protein PBAL39_23762 [Pedobacter sp. BAL39]
MKNCSVKKENFPTRTAGVPLLILAILLISASCKKGLTEQQKVFLDYAKLEDTYHFTGYYRNADFYSTTTEAPAYSDSAFNINTFKNNLKNTFKLIAEGSNYEPYFEGDELQYPHEYKFQPQKDGSVQVTLSVFVPDTFYKFSLGRNEIGKTIEKDSAEVTLLDMTNDGATLLVKNNGIRRSYDYTYDGVDKKDYSENKNEPESTAIGYGNYLFSSETLESPNTQHVRADSNLITSKASRLSISATDETGETLLSDGRINDFRHYLWYRNHDMPYPELASQYRDMMYRYKEEDMDSLHKFNPIDIVNIKTSGKIEKVEFFLRSAKGHIETIDLGHKVPEARQERKGPKMIKVQFLPIQNLTKEDAGKILKVGFAALTSVGNENQQFQIYASLPKTYNSMETKMYFNDLMIFNAKDSVNVENTESSNSFFEFGWSDNAPNNVKAIHFKTPLNQPTKITGKIELKVPHYTDREFKVGNLPKSITTSADGLTFTFVRGAEEFNNVAEIYAFKASDKKNSIALSYPENETDSAKQLNIKFKEKPASIIIRYIEKKGLETEIAFEFEIPQKTK